MKRTATLVAVAVLVTACGGHAAPPHASPSAHTPPPASASTPAKESTFTLRPAADEVLATLARESRAATVPAQGISATGHAEHALLALSREAASHGVALYLHNAAAALSRLVADMLRYPQFAVSGTDAQMPPKVRADVTYWDEQLGLLRYALAHNP